MVFHIQDCHFGLLLKYLSIKDGLKPNLTHFGFVLIQSSKVPVHKRWIETSTRFSGINSIKKLLKYLSIKDGLKLTLS